MKPWLAGAHRSLLTMVLLGSLAHSAEFVNEQTYHGMCDASAGIILNDDLFIAADDESNLLLTFSRSRPGRPIHTLRLDAFLQTDRKHPEADIEGAARIGDVVYWITSHGQNKHGEERTSRERFFATRVEGNNLVPAGKPYTRLVADLAAAPQLQPYNLAAAARLAPKSQGALNIEGMALGEGGTLLIGFRNPIPNGKALIVPLLNPGELVDEKEEGKARFGDPILLDLEGRGIRDITFADGQWYLLAGSYDGKGKTDFYRWDGKSAPRLLGVEAPKKFNPEVIMPLDAGKTFLILSDDGTTKIGGKDCKTLPESARRFRSYVLRL